MCQYSYLRYELCKHFAIEVQSYCASARWQAAMTGVLYLCCPLLLDSENCDIDGTYPWVKPPPVKWHGIKGSCRKCVEKYKIPANTFEQTHTEHYLPESLSCNPLDVRSLAPYVYCPYLAETLPSLLGIGEAFEATELNQGPRVIFAWRLEQTSWVNLKASVPFINQGMWEEAPEEGMTTLSVLKSLEIDMGFTKEDERSISEFLNQGISEEGLADIWKAGFEGRGMPYDWFYIVCRNLALSKQMDKFFEGAEL